MKRCLWLCLGLLIVLSLPLRAQGVLVAHWPPDHRRPHPMPMPRPPDFRPHTLGVKSLRFETSIENQVARTRVTQVFVNDSSWVLEGTYLFPLPEEATVSDFAIYEGDRKLQGEVLDKDRARQTYESIVRQIRDPGLLEYAGRNLLQARVFPVPARGEKKIELAYTQILKADAGLVRYVYPLGTGGRTLPSPIRSVAGSVRLQSGVPLRNIYSPSHALSVDRRGDHAATASFETSDLRDHADFQLYYSFSEKDFGLNLLSYRQPGEDGYFLLLLSPKVDLRSDEVSSKDIVFVFDTSGSMNDEGKIDKAREALKFGIRSLNAGDRFNLIAFATEERAFRSELVPVSRENVELALQFAAELRAAGGTNIYDALGSALRTFTVSERPRYLVFLTDGLPTVGETAVDRILARVRELNDSRVRVFTFGVGYDVNTFLLDQLANTNHGAPDYVAPKEDLEVKVSAFFEKINQPVLSELRLQVPGLGLAELYPRQLPDLFKGSQLTLLGRYRDDGRFTIRLEGSYRSETRRFEYPDQPFPRQASDAVFLPRLWASRKVGYLLDQIRLNGETAEVKEEVIRLAKQYGFVTPYTSYLAADDREMARGRILPLFAHPGLAGRAKSAAPEAMAIDAREMQAQTGAGAVTTSQAIQLMKTADTAVAGQGARTQVIGEKTFVLQDDIWVDSAYRPDSGLPVVRLTFGDEEYFSLVSKQPRLARYLSLGENVTVVFEGQVFELRK